MSTATMDELDAKADDIPAGDGFGAKDLKNLPDGEYQFEIKSAEFGPTKKSGHQLFKMDCEVIDGAQKGTVVQVPHFLTGDKGVNEAGVGILRKDLGILGFDQDKWVRANNRTFSGELKKAALYMPGLRFKGKKVTNGQYANLYVNERLKTDGKPAAIGPAELDGAAKENEDPFKV